MGVRVTFGLLRVPPEYHDPAAYLRQGGHPITPADFFEYDADGYRRCILCNGKYADANHFNSEQHKDRANYPECYLEWNALQRRYTRQ